MAICGNGVRSYPPMYPPFEACLDRAPVSLRHRGGGARDLQPPGYPSEYLRAGKRRGGGTGGGTNTIPRPWPPLRISGQAASPRQPTPKRHVSQEARQRMSRAQRSRHLTARQERFVKHFAHLPNASAAARAAGYRDGPGIGVTACRTLKKANGHLEEIGTLGWSRWTRLPAFCGLCAVSVGTVSTVSVC